MQVCDGSDVECSKTTAAHSPLVRFSDSLALPRTSGLGNLTNSPQLQCWRSSKCAMAAMSNVQRPKLHLTHLQTLRGPVGWCLMCLHLIYCKYVKTSTEAFQFSVTSLTLNYTTYLHLGRNASKNLHTHEHIIAGLAAVLTNYYLLFSDNMIFF